MVSRVYAIAQQKGGVAKTTSTINLGAALVERGHRVLVVDSDPQGALSVGLGVEPLQLGDTLYNALRDPDFPLSRVLITNASECHLIPANIDLSASELELVSEPGRERILRDKLSPLLDSYDYILIDCPPSLSLLTLNALSAASRVIVPVATQYFALRGMDLLFQTIAKVKARLNPELEIAGVLATMYDSRTIHSREVLDELQSAYKEKLFTTVIPFTVKLQDSVMAGQSILKLTPASPASQAYRNLAVEVEQRG